MFIIKCCSLGLFAVQLIEERRPTPPAEVEGSVVNSIHDDGLPGQADNGQPISAYMGMAPPPTQAPDNQRGTKAYVWLIINEMEI